MNFVADLLPVILFFACFHLFDIYVATGVAVAAAVIQVAYLKMRGRPVTTMQWVTLGLFVVFGGLTLALRDPMFVKWKPTIVNWLFGAVFLAAPLFTKRLPIERLIGHAVNLPRNAWQRLNLAWALFFLVLGGVNLFVAYRYEEAVWVNFKLFGLVGLTLLFALAQGFYLARHMIPEAVKEE